MCTLLVQFVSRTNNFKHPYCTIRNLHIVLICESWAMNEMELFATSSTTERNTYISSLTSNFSKVKLNILREAEIFSTNIKLACGQEKLECTTTLWYFCVWCFPHKCGHFSNDFSNVIFFNFSFSVFAFFQRQILCLPPPAVLSILSPLPSPFDSAILTTATKIIQVMQDLYLC